MVIVRYPLSLRIAPAQALICHCTIAVCELYGLVAHTLSRRNEGADFLTPPFIVTPSGVVSAVYRCCPDFSVSLTDESQKGLCIGNIVQRQVSAENVVCIRINSQMMLSPDTAEQDLPFT